MCCNLIVNGDVSGDVFLVSGNGKIDLRGEVDGDLQVISGNVSR